MGSGRTVGTRLRHLIDLLDGAVQQAYNLAGLDYRPRFTPVVRVLQEVGSASIRSIAENASLTHSAASQTVAQMEKFSLVTVTAGKDGRERIIEAAPRLLAMLPALERQWVATGAAAVALDAELNYPLADLLAEAIAALEVRPFDERIADQISASREPSC